MNQRKNPHKQSLRKVPTLINPRFVLSSNIIQKIYNFVKNFCSDLPTPRQEMIYNMIKDMHENKPAPGEFSDEEIVLLIRYNCKRLRDPSLSKTILPDPTNQLGEWVYGPLSRDQYFRTNIDERLTELWRRLPINPPWRPAYQDPNIAYEEVFTHCQQMASRKYICVLTQDHVAQINSDHWTLYEDREYHADARRIVNNSRWGTKYIKPLPRDEQMLYQNIQYIAVPVTHPPIKYLYYVEFEVEGRTVSTVGELLTFLYPPEEVDTIRTQMWRNFDLIEGSYQERSENIFKSSLVDRSLAGGSNNRLKFIDGEGVDFIINARPFNIWCEGKQKQDAWKIHNTGTQHRSGNLLRYTDVTLLDSGLRPDNELEVTSSGFQIKTQRGAPVFLKFKDIYYGRNVTNKLAYAAALNVRIDTTIHETRKQLYKHWEPHVYLLSKATQDADYGYNVGMINSIDCFRFFKAVGNNPASIPPIVYRGPSREYEGVTYLLLPKRVTNKFGSAVITPDQRAVNFGTFRIEDEVDGPPARKIVTIVTIGPR